MNDKILNSCGIKKVYTDGRIILTDEAEMEVRALVECEQKHEGINMFRRCVYCYHHLEALNDLCEIQEKRTLCFDLCDQFKKKITKEEAIILGYLDGFSLGDEEDE